MKISSLPLIAIAAFPLLVSAQSTKSAEPLPDALQIASAVSPLPAEYRAHARVLGYHAGSHKLVELRTGTEFTCLASDPASSRFHVACYHQSLEPFMARGRELREQGVTGDKVDTVRFAEIKSGKLVMPRGPTALYQLNGPPSVVDPTTGAVKGAIPLNVIYIPYATPATTGLSAQPVEGSPWIMYPGTPKAHIMLVPKM